MDRTIKDNQYKEAPQQAPYTLGPSILTKEQREASSREYKKYCVERVLALDPTLSIHLNLRTDLVIDTPSEVTWNKDLIEQQLPDQLRDLATLIENWLDLPKELR